MNRISKLCFILFFILYPFFLFGQVLVTPKISSTHNYYYWNFNSTIEDPQEWTWGVGAIARIPFSKKLYGQFSFTIYPLGLSIIDERSGPHLPDFVVTTYTDIFDIKLGIDYKLYPNSLLGVGIEMEQYFNSSDSFSINGIDDIAYLNQKFFGFEVSLTQWLGKIEISADVFIGLQEGGTPSQPVGLSNGPLVFFSHKKLQLGIGIPINLKR